MQESLSKLARPMLASPNTGESSTLKFTIINATHLTFLITQIGKLLKKVHEIPFGNFFAVIAAISVNLIVDYF